MSYKIVSGRSVDELVAIVNEHIKRGYEPIGGFKAFGMSYAQTLYAKKERETETILNNEDAMLFNQLKNKRKELSDKIGAPAYVVATNRMLESLISIKPSTKDELKNVYGFGPQKIELYGDIFLEIMNA